MIRLTKFATLAGLAVGALLPAQEETKPPTQPSNTPSNTPSKTPSETQKSGATADSGQFVKELGSENYKARLEAEQHLRAMGKDALPALKSAAEQGTDPEVQWRARRLIRQIERGDQQPGLGRHAERSPGEVQPRSGNLDPTDPVQGRFDQLFRQLERDFGVDIPRQRFFGDGFFRDLQSQMDDLRARMDQGLQGVPGQQQGMSMQMGPDGVKVQIKTRNEKGEEETKSYEAPDLESFQKKYPGVLEGNGIAGPLLFHRLFDDGNQLFTMPQVRSFAWPPTARARRVQPDDVPNDFAEPPPPAPVAPPESMRLGIRIRPEIAPELREHLGLGESEGLMVEEVQEGTLAETLGLKAGDIVVKIGDHAIGSAQDVQDALGPIDAGKDVAVHAIRRGKPVDLVAKKIASSSDAEAKAGAAKSGQKGETKLEKRAPKSGAIR